MIPKKRTTRQEKLSSGQIIYPDEPTTIKRPMREANRIKTRDKKKDHWMRGPYNRSNDDTTLKDNNKNKKMERKLLLFFTKNQGENQKQEALRVHSIRFNFFFAGRFWLLTLTLDTASVSRKSKGTNHKTTHERMNVFKVNLRVCWSWESKIKERTKRGCKKVLQHHLFFWKLNDWNFSPPVKVFRVSLLLIKWSEFS